MKLGQKYKNIFVGFLVQMKTFKFAFEINRPLGFRCVQHLKMTVIAFVKYLCVFGEKMATNGQKAAIYSVANLGKQIFGPTG